jgi:radical SAM protein with 4Fe4S-binding SPASM domain
MSELIVELVVTEECNLGCTYCYMDNRSVYMTRSDVIAFQENVGTMMKVYGKSSYHISFFGGEPLLNWDLIQFAVPRFKADSRCSSIVVITNGLLLDDEKLQWLQQQGVGISLSFDGLWNDINRPLKKGAPSLPLYRRKMELFHKYGLRSCKVMIGPASAATMVENFKFFIDDFGFYNPDFSIVRDNIWSWEDVDVFKQALHALAEEIIYRFNCGTPATVGLFNLMLLDMLFGSKKGKRSMGCFAGCGGVGFVGGVFYPCARFGSEGAYPLLDTRTGTYFSENIEKLKSPSFCDPRAYADCEGCEIRRYCNGGCNKSLLEYGEGVMAKPIPQVCALYKSVASETLWIHQQLKFNDTYKSYIKGLVTPYLDPQRSCR